MENLETLDYVDRTENKSSGRINRLRVYFKNGFELSVVHSSIMYGNEKLYEIAVLDKDGNFQTNVFEGDYIDEEVMGHLKSEEVMYYIKKIGGLMKLIEGEI